MKTVIKSVIITALFIVQIAWSGTTRVVLQNAFDGGYKGCQDTYIDEAWELPTGEEERLTLLYELCET